VISIFCARLVGSATSFVVKNDVAVVLMKLFSAGVILSLSIVHIIPEVSVGVNEDDAYPFGSLCILVGLVSLAIFENLSHTFTFTTPIEKKHGNNDIEEHHHSCIINNDLKQNINPYIFEFACVFHSVLIGISLGIQEEDNMKVVLIALIFHQFLEGASIGWIMSDIGIIKKLVMIFVYSTSTPSGILIGKNIDGINQSELWAICLLGLSGGMLIYISLIQIFIEEMSKQDLHKKEHLWKKIHCYISFLVGMASMSVIAIWV
jgi:zinc transporter ZupT